MRSFFSFSFPEPMRGARVARAGMLHAAALTVVTAALTSTVLPEMAQAAGVPGQGTWETTLQGRDLDGDASNGFEAYYDTVLDITWLADASAGGGLMDWRGAKSWVESLDVHGIKGWRLPAVKPVNGSSFNNDLSYGGSTDRGFNITSTQSELAHLFHVTLGNKSSYDAFMNYHPDRGLTNPGPFSNIRSAGYDTYWAGLQCLPGGFVDCAWMFNFKRGGQDFYSMYTGFDVAAYAWAVRPGDVVTQVPEPQAYALALVGLATAVVARGRRQRH